MCATVASIGELTKSLPLQWTNYLLPLAITTSSATEPDLSVADWDTLIRVVEAHQLAPLLYWQLRTRESIKQPTETVYKRHIRFISRRIYGQ